MTPGRRFAWFFLALWVGASSRGYSQECCGEEQVNEAKRLLGMLRVELTLLKKDLLKVESELKNSKGLLDTALQKTYALEGTLEESLATSGMLRENFRVLSGELTELRVSFETLKGSWGALQSERDLLRWAVGGTVILGGLGWLLFLVR